MVELHLMIQVRMGGSGQTWASVRGGWDGWNFSKFMESPSVVFAFYIIERLTLANFLLVLLAHLITDSFETVLY